MLGIEITPIKHFVAFIFGAKFKNLTSGQKVAENSAVHS